jgi:segregation and condensation protein A
VADTARTSTPEAGPDDTSGRSPYRVKIEAFEGPFDLLLQLIAEREMDVYEVDLADITGDFLAHLRPDGRHLDLETATHFLVVAATLVELKAVRLLPSDSGDEYDDLLLAARDLLYARLLEYRAFRDVSAVLAAMFEDNAAFHGRVVALEPRFRDLVPPVEEEIDAHDLARRAALVTRRRPEARVDTTHIHRAVLSVREAAGRLLARVGEGGRGASYRAIVADLSRPARIAHFLAVLELYKLGLIDIEQTGPPGDLTLLRRPGEASLSVLDEQTAR